METEKIYSRIREALAEYLKFHDNREYDLLIPARQLGEVMNGLESSKMGGG
jgi:hypothetical protein